LSSDDLDIRGYRSQCSRETSRELEVGLTIHGRSTNRYFESSFFDA